MSIPQEEIDSAGRTFYFLKRIAEGEYKRVPVEVRREALALFRHFPGPTAMKIYWHRGQECNASRPKPAQEKA